MVVSNVGLKIGTPKKIKKVLLILGTLNPISKIPTLNLGKPTDVVDVMKLELAWVG